MNVSELFERAVAALERIAASTDKPLAKTTSAPPVVGRSPFSLDPMADSGQREASAPASADVDRIVILAADHLRNRSQNRWTTVPSLFKAIGVRPKSRLIVHQEEHAALAARVFGELANDVRFEVHERSLRTKPEYFWRTAARGRRVTAEHEGAVNGAG